MKRCFEKIFTCPLQPEAILPDRVPFKEEPKKTLNGIENHGVVRDPLIVRHVCQNLNIQYYPWYGISIQKTKSTFYQVGLWEEKNHIVNSNAYPIYMPITMLKGWADVTVGFDKVGPYLQIGEGNRLYELTLIDKWVKDIIFIKSNPLRNCPIRLVKVDLDNQHIRFEADIVNVYGNDYYERISQ